MIKERTPALFSCGLFAEQARKKLKPTAAYRQRCHYHSPLTTCPLPTRITLHPLRDFGVASPTSPISWTAFAGC